MKGIWAKDFEFLQQALRLHLVSWQDTVHQEELSMSQWYDLSYQLKAMAARIDNLLDARAEEASQRCMDFDPSKATVRKAYHDEHPY